MTGAIVLAHWSLRDRVDKPVRAARGCRPQDGKQRMALFEFFPNDLRNPSVPITSESGGRIGEIVDRCAPARAATGGAEAVGADTMRCDRDDLADRCADLSK